MEREEIEGRVATAKVFDEDYQTILSFRSHAVNSLSKQKHLSLFVNKEQILHVA